MKVDKNQLVTPVECATTDMDTGLPIYRTAGGIPLRLEIAARITAGISAANSDDKWSDGWIVRHALELADRLIAAHNETCGAGE